MVAQCGTLINTDKTWSRVHVQSEFSVGNDFAQVRGNVVCDKLFNRHDQKLCYPVLGYVPIHGQICNFVTSIVTENVLANRGDSDPKGTFKN